MIVAAFYTLFRLRQSLLRGIGQAVRNLQAVKTGTQQANRLEIDLDFRKVGVAIPLLAIPLFFLYWFFSGSFYGALILTVVMMVLMPLFCRWLGMDPLVAGAWIGGTIDSTGAVVAAGQLLGDQAMQTAAVIKMIQNVLIGVVAFFIALYWVTRIEPAATGRPGLVEIWNRFPKFVLGFILASLVVSLLFVPLLGSEQVDESLGISKNFRAWFFCLAFLCIGMDSNFRVLRQQMGGGRPLLLYCLGQSLNLVLTLLVAWLVFSGIIFPKLNL